MNEAQAIALAEKHGANTDSYEGHLYIGFWQEQLAAMLTDNRAQVIEELVSSAPEKVHVFDFKEADWCAWPEVREALAVMQAKLEQAQGHVESASTEIAELYTELAALNKKLEQAQADAARYRWLRDRAKPVKSGSG